MTDENQPTTATAEPAQASTRDSALRWLQANQNVERARVAANEANSCLTGAVRELEVAAEAFASLFTNSSQRRVIVGLGPNEVLVVARNEYNASRPFVELVQVL